MERERLTEAPSALTGAVKLHEVGVQEVEDGTVTRAETAAAALEAEHLGLPGGACGAGASMSSTTVWLHPEVVQPDAVELAPGEEVRES